MFTLNGGARAKIGRLKRMFLLEIKEQDHVHPQWGSKSENWLIQEDVPIGGLDLEEEEHAAPTDAKSLDLEEKEYAAPTDAKSHKKQLRHSNIREQDQVRLQWGSKSENWSTLEDVPSGGLDFEEEEHATPTGIKSQKKQLRHSNRIKALQIMEQDHIRPQCGSKNGNWSIQEDVEEEEHAALTDPESQKKQLGSKKVQNSMIRFLVQ
nr:hypothetical protein CFP56_50254 [Quercus suber]